MALRKAIITVMLSTLLVSSTAVPIYAVDDKESSVDTVMIKRRIIYFVLVLIVLTLCGCNDISSGDNVEPSDYQLAETSSESSLKMLPGGLIDSSNTIHIPEGEEENYKGGTTSNPNGQPKITVTYPKLYKDVTPDKAEFIQLNRADDKLSVTICASYLDKDSSEDVLNKDKWSKAHSKSWVYDKIKDEKIGDKKVTYVISGDYQTSLYHSLKAEFKTGVKCKAYTGETTELIINVIITHKDYDFDFTDGDATKMINLMYDLIPTIEVDTDGMNLNID